jgi:hypothetical protein
VPGGRTCSECPNEVTGRAITCGATCRSARRRRVDRQAASGRTVGALVTDDAERAAQEILRDELRPVVREALTEDVLRHIRTVIGKVPAAIDVLVGLLGSRDEDTRRQAAVALLRYSVGNKAIVPDINDGGTAPLTVHFNLDRPDAVGVGTAYDIVDFRTCDSCGEKKDADQFVSTSDRCQTCFDTMRASVAQLVE